MRIMVKEEGVVSKGELKMYAQMLGRSGGKKRFKNTTKQERIDFSRMGIEKRRANRLSKIDTVQILGFKKV